MVPGAIDVHAHYLTANYASACRDAGYDHPDGMPTLPDWSRELALGVMDQIGVSASILSISSPGVDFAPDPTALARQTNDEGAAIVGTDPDRFGVAAVLPMSNPAAAAAEARRCLTVLGMDAVSLHTHCAGSYLGDATYDPILAELDMLSAIVLIHPTSPPGWERTALGRPRPMIEFLFDTTRAVTNLIMTGTMQRFPAIRWIIPHAGATLPVLADRIQVFTAMSPGPSPDVVAALQRCYYDLAGAALPRGLPALRALVSDDRLLFGSDYPFTPEQAVVGLAAELASNPLTVPGGVLTANARKLFPRFAEGG